MMKTSASCSDLANFVAWSHQCPIRKRSAIHREISQLCWFQLGRYTYHKCPVRASPSSMTMSSSLRLSNCSNVFHGSTQFLKLWMLGFRSQCLSTGFFHCPTTSQDDWWLMMTCFHCPPCFGPDLFSCQFWDQSWSIQGRFRIHGDQRQRTIRLVRICKLRSTDQSFCRIYHAAFPWAVLWLEACFNIRELRQFIAFFHSGLRWYRFYRHSKSNFHQQTSQEQ